MEYLALFVWLAGCLLLGSLVHWLVEDALCYRPVRWIAAPGLAVRKFSMTIATLITGGTVTHARLYDPSESDVTFQSNGPAGVARVLTPLAPLFGAAFVLALLNTTFGGPLHLDRTVPGFSQLSVDGIAAFITESARLLSAVIRDVPDMGWGTLGTYVFLIVTFSLVAGAYGRIENVKEPLLGAAVVSVVLALTAAIAAERTALGTLSLPYWFESLSGTILAYAATGFVMTIYGTLAALGVAMVARAWQLVDKHHQHRDSDDKVQRIDRRNHNRKDAA